MKILGYYKTKHFSERQKERDVPDKLLENILPIIVSHEKQLLVISKKLIRNYIKKCKVELFIKKDGNALITCFYCDFQNYLLTARKGENYCFINQLNN